MASLKAWKSRLSPRQKYPSRHPASTSPRAQGIPRCAATPRVGFAPVKSHDFPDLYRRAADYVDKILRGAKPGDIPVRLEHSLSMGVVNESGRGRGRCLLLRWRRQFLLPF